MALWEYKIITSGKGGFASPNLLEAYLNQLGKDEWEIIQFHTNPDNPLAFNGMARRPTQREWTLEAAVAAAAKSEADKLRAELIQQHHSGEPVAASSETSATESTESVERPLAAEAIRKVRDTERDNDPEALAAEEEGLGVGDWDDFDEFDDDLPTFFDAIKPHQRKNQKGPGSAVGVDFLAKRWEQTEADIIGALRECGFTVPASEDEDPVYVEFEGDLYWLNCNSRGAIYINTREKPRPIFRVVKARELADDDPAAIELAEEHAVEQAERKRRAEEQAARDAEAAARRAEQEARRQEEADRRAQEKAEREAKAAELAAQPLPEGEPLLVAIAPFMRRNRRGPGHSGSINYLAKALHHSEEELLAGLSASGLTIPEESGLAPTYTEIGENVYWVNKDGRGGIWINGCEKKDHQDPAEPAADTPTDEAGAQKAPSRDGASEEAAQAAKQPKNPTATTKPKNEAGTETPAKKAIKPAEPASSKAESESPKGDKSAKPEADSAADADDAASAKKKKPATPRTRSRRGPVKQKDETKRTDSKKTDSASAD